METRNATDVSRRSFLQQLSVAGLGTLLVDTSVLASEGTPALPTAVLGKTKHRMTRLGLGTWPCGKSSDVGVDGVARLVQEALELGIDFIDTAHNYGVAEEGIAKGLGKRRNQVFLTTKVWADTAAEASTSLEQSLRTLQTDHLDLVYLHSVGNRDVARVLGPGGALEYLLEQKAKGTTRFVGISGHSKVKDFLPLIDTGKIDVVMMAMNFVDRHTYGFEDKVLPAARRRGMGVICMKAYGGMQGGFATAGGPAIGSMVQKALLQQAVRYALDLPGVTSLVIGPHTVEQLRENVRFVRSYKPLSSEEQQSLTTLGKQMATKWGPHFGPVA